MNLWSCDVMLTTYNLSPIGGKGEQWACTLSDEVYVQGRWSCDLGVNTGATSFVVIGICVGSTLNYYI